MEVFELEVGNYRGNLQIAKDIDKFSESNNKYYWRVGCDFEKESWVKINREVYEELEKYNEKEQLDDECSPDT